jgi:NAD(P)H-dependent FMN reductase
MNAGNLVISTSLNPDSRSRLMARQAYKYWTETGSAELIDLRDYRLPVCDGDTCYAHPDVITLTEKIKQAPAILLAVPIYNYSAPASAKNLVELTGSAWEEKIVGFLCAAGGKSSYMSILGLANSLMLDFRCLINPRFVYTDGSAFEAEEITDDEVKRRIKELTESTTKLIGRLASKV